MDPERLLQSLGLALNVPDVGFDANGCARLEIDGTTALDFECGEDGKLHIYSVLGALPPHGREVLYAELLKGNLFGASTGGASLAIDFSYGEVVLCRCVATQHAVAHEFASEIEAFVAAAEHWKGRLAGALGDSPVDDRAASFPAPRMIEHFLRG
jgi:hypothetical protein